MESEEEASLKKKRVNHRTRRRKGASLLIDVATLHTVVPSVLPPSPSPSLAILFLICIRWGSVA